MPTSAGRPLKVAIMCHREIVARGLVAILSEHPERVSVMKLPSIMSPVRTIDVVIYDLLLAPEGEQDRLGDLVQQMEGRVIGLVGAPGSPSVATAEALGAAGCLTLESTTTEVLAGVGRAAVGLRLPGTNTTADLLSGRERSIVEMVFGGLSNAEIAEKLAISPNTLKSHIRSAYQKMGVRSRAQAVAWCALHGVAFRGD